MVSREISATLVAVGLIVLGVGLASATTGFTVLPTAVSDTTLEVRDVPDQVRSGEDFYFHGRLSGRTSGTFVTWEMWTSWHPEVRRSLREKPGDGYWSSGWVNLSGIAPEVDAAQDRQMTIHAKANGWEGSKKVTVEVVPEAEPTHNLMINKVAKGEPAEVPARPGSTSPTGDRFHTYEHGKTVEVSVTSVNPGWEFLRWEGAVSSTEKTISVTMDEDKTLRAIFLWKKARPTYTLNVEIVGRGSVTPMSGQFREGESVTLTATPAENFKFSHWSGGISGTKNPITFTMDSGKTVYAHFSVPGTHKIIVGVAPDSRYMGTVSGSGTYEQGETVTISADPKEGNAFDYWSGDVTGAENPKTFEATDDMEILAHFSEEAPETATLTVKSRPPKGGAVGFGQSKTMTVEKGETVALQAYPNSGWSFDEWSGDISGKSASTTITVSDDMTAVAEFSPVAGPLDWAKANISAILVAVGSFISAIGSVAFLRPELLAMG